MAIRKILDKEGHFGRPSHLGVSEVDEYAVIAAEIRLAAKHDLSGVPVELNNVCSVQDADGEAAALDLKCSIL